MQYHSLAQGPGTKAGPNINLCLHRNFGANDTHAMCGYRISCIYIFNMRSSIRAP